MSNSSIPSHCFKCHLPIHGESILVYGTPDERHPAIYHPDCAPRYESVKVVGYHLPPALLEALKWAVTITTARTSIVEFQKAWSAVEKANEKGQP